MKKLLWWKTNCFNTIGSSHPFTMKMVVAVLLLGIWQLTYPLRIPSLLIQSWRRYGLRNCKSRGLQRGLVLCRFRRHSQICLKKNDSMNDGRWHSHSMRFLIPISGKSTIGVFRVVLSWSFRISAGWSFYGKDH